MYPGASLNWISPSRPTRSLPRSIFGRSPTTALLALLRDLFGAGATIEVVTDFRGFSTDPGDPALSPLFSILAERTGRDPVPLGAPYFTDASALVPGFGRAPTVVIGPGEPSQCHKTDEHCPVAQIDEATAIYEALMRRLCL